MLIVNLHSVHTENVVSYVLLVSDMTETNDHNVKHSALRSATQHTLLKHLIRP